MFSSTKALLKTQAMSLTLRSLALGVLLTASTLVCLVSCEVSDCQPEIPPQTNPNASMVALQMHQWIWIENLTSPDWAPKTDSGGMVYEYLRPGFVRQQRLPLLVFVNRLRFVYINVSYVTNGDTLCAAALTVHMNRTSGDTDRVSCSRICHGNFTSLGTRAQLPLLVYDDWTAMRRENEYMAFDAVDPDSRASYTCMGLFKYEWMPLLPGLMSRQKQCPEGDECLFNYDKDSNLVDGGCQSDFREYSWCVSDINLCSFNIDGNCPICCRGNLCNREVAQKAYKRWQEGNAASSASSFWMLTVCTLGLLWGTFYL